MPFDCTSPDVARAVGGAYGVTGRIWVGRQVVQSITPPKAWIAMFTKKAGGRRGDSVRHNEVQQFFDSFVLTSTFEVEFLWRLMLVPKSVE